MVNCFRQSVFPYITCVRVRNSLSMVRSGIAQCNWSESRYGIFLSLVFRVFTTFTITIISEVTKRKEKLSRNYHRSDVVKFYTSMFMFVVKKINK